MKKFISIFLLFYFIPIATASTTPLVKIGGRFYDTLESAINAVGEYETISLISNIKLDKTLKINKVVNINLNGNDISAYEKVFEINGGALTLSGKGTIKEINPNYGAVMIIGSHSPVEKYSTISVGEDVTLEGWSGIFINHDNSKSYGVYVDFEGKINSFEDASGITGAGIYINGKIQDKDYSPVINIMDGAEIKSTGNGLYIAGYSTFNIGDAYIEGIESAIGIKSGKLVIDGATLICNGEDKTPTEGYTNGIKASGTTIQIESNSAYAGNIELDISRGKFVSKNSNVIYEYIGKGDSSKIYSMSVSGGSFVSGKNKDVFSFSESFKDIHSGFISGGEYKTNPDSYLKNGYQVVADEMYNVVKSNINSVNGNSIRNSNDFIKCLITLFLILIISVIIYLNRVKLYKLLNTKRY